MVPSQELYVMMEFYIRFRNPWPSRPFCNLACWSWPLTRNKTFELQFSRYAFNWLEAKLDLNWRQTDHAGPWIMINVFGWTMDARIYDRRHWDDANNAWRDDATR